jgi:hypothetical protein
MLRYCSLGASTLVVAALMGCTSRSSSPTEEADAGRDTRSPPNAGGDAGEAVSLVAGEFMKTPDGKSLPVPFPLDSAILGKDPKCHAVDLDGDGSFEVIVEWVDLERDRTHWYRVYRAQTSGEYRLLSEFGLGDTANGGLGFLREPDPSRPWKAVIGVQGGASWGAFHVVWPDGTGADEVGSGTTFKHQDLDGDGIQEWIFTQKHNEIQELVWNRHMMCVEVSRWNEVARRYRKVWPRPQDGLLQVGALLTDLDGDARVEILALMDGQLRAPQTRSLCLYRWKESAWHLAARVPAVRSEPPVDILAPNAVGGRIRILLATAAPQTDEYELHGDSLEPK